MKINMYEKLQDLELRVTNLSNRSVRLGELQERKRIADLMYEEYQEAFTADPVYAEKLYALIGRVTADV